MPRVRRIFTRRWKRPAEYDEYPRIGGGPFQELPGALRRRRLEPSIREHLLEHVAHERVSVQDQNPPPCTLRLRGCGRILVDLRASRCPAHEPEGPRRDQQVYYCAPQPGYGSGVNESLDISETGHSFNRIESRTLVRVETDPG